MNVEILSVCLCVCLSWTGTIFLFVLVTLYQPLHESMRMGTMKLSKTQVKAQLDLMGTLWGTTSLATVDTDTFDGTLWTLWIRSPPMSLLIPNLFIFAQILDWHFQYQSIIITPLLLFQYTQFPHTRCSPHNVQHSSSFVCIPTYIVWWFCGNVVSDLLYFARSTIIGSTHRLFIDLAAVGLFSWYCRNTTYSPWLYCLCTQKLSAGSTWLSIHFAHMTYQYALHMPAVFVIVP